MSTAKKLKSTENATQKEFEKPSDAPKRVNMVGVRSLPLTDDPLRNQVIMDYAPLIKYIAQKIAARLPSNIDLDDLFSSGVIGLMDAIDKYDPSRDNKFKTYAEFAQSRLGASICPRKQQKRRPCPGRA
jgi:RNA polymerase sigma factor FliA